MPLLDEIRASTLIDLAHARFDPEISEAELKVLRDSASSGELPVPTEIPTLPMVRAEFLRWLASDPETAPHIDPQGLRVYAATVSGDFDLRECRILPRLVFCRSIIQRSVNLRGARTSGIFVYMSILAQGLDADRAIIQGGLFLRGAQSMGEISLIGTDIGSDLDCAGTRLKSNGAALNADRARIGGSVYLNQGFESDGSIHLSGTAIAGNLECDRAKLNAEKSALCADGAIIAGSVFLREGFEANGEISLIDAAIAGQLSFTRATLNAKADALSADRVKIAGNVFLHQGFSSEGRIRFPGAILGGDLAIRGAKVAAVNCQNAVIAGDLFWQSIENPMGASLFLSGARVKSLRDDRQSWPAKGKLHLNGLIYGELTLHRSPSPQEIANSSSTGALELDVEDRVQWLMRQPPEEISSPQPWLQLSSHMEGKGDHEAAKHVIFNYHCLLVAQKWPLWRGLLVAFFWLEENPVRIGLSIAAALLIGWLVFSHAATSGALAPTDPEAYKAFTSGNPMPAAYPVLNPFIYTVDNAVPLVHLGQDDKWAPDKRHPSTDPFTSYWFLMWARWLLILSGWFQATIFAAAISGIFKE